MAEETKSLIGELTSTFLVTANIGSIFDDPINLIPEWNTQIFAKIQRLQPLFMALHCQEIGGKNFEENMVHVDSFVSHFIERGQSLGYDRILAFFDKNFEASDKFTALGSIYLVYHTVKDVQLFNFDAMKYETIVGHHMHLGTVEAQPLVEKYKFPRQFFPNNQWSRKGYLRTRWRINDTAFDLINIHLFHDASNYKFIDTFPSIYSKYRSRALQHTLNLLHLNPLPFFIFGDFNFRLNGLQVLRRLTGESHFVTSSDSRHYRDVHDDVILRVGVKEFSCSKNHDEIFKGNWKEWKDLDMELEAFKTRLTEFPLSFPPTYPFEENIYSSSQYMKTRCPAWCDRVLLSLPTIELIHNPPQFSYAEESKRSEIGVSSVLYDIIGRNACMGDHKPVFLLFNLKSNIQVSLPDLIPYSLNDPETPRVESPNYTDLLSSSLTSGHVIINSTLTNYREIKDENSVKLFKETTV